MKNLFTKYVLPITIAVIMVYGCNFSSKTKENKCTTSSGKKASIEIRVFDAVKVKNQIVETIITFLDICSFRHITKRKPPDTA